METIHQNNNRLLHSSLVQRRAEMRARKSNLFLINTNRAHKCWTDKQTYSCRANSTILFLLHWCCSTETATKQKKMRKYICYAPLIIIPIFFIVRTLFPGMKKSRSNVMNNVQIKVFGQGVVVNKWSCMR